jgi:hypothetical protein
VLLRSASSRLTQQLRSLWQPQHCSHVLPAPDGDVCDDVFAVLHWTRLGCSTTQCAMWVPALEMETAAAAGMEVLMHLCC